MTNGLTAEASCFPSDDEASLPFDINRIGGKCVNYHPYGSCTFNAFEVEVVVGS
jgi:hypothetical protein